MHYLNKIYLNIFSVFFNCCSSIVVFISRTTHHHLPPSILPPSTLSMGPLYMFFDDPFPSFLSPSLSCYHPPSPPLVIVSLFFISFSLVIFCLLVCFADQVPLIGEIVWYLSFIAWLFSLSVMLFSSIHAVTKGRSSFFLSAVQYSITKVFDPLIY